MCHEGLFEDRLTSKALDSHDLSVRIRVGTVLCIRYGVHVLLFLVGASRVNGRGLLRLRFRGEFMFVHLRKPPW